jgi:dolichol-phosphate mannosyltransferase
MNIVLIPTYNERENIAKIISRIRQYDAGIKIMVIDDNSPDGTKEVVKELMANDQGISILERQKKEGLGMAYIDAFNRVTSDSEPPDNIIIMDADGSHDPQCIPAMLQEIKRVDVVVGSRYVEGGGVRGWPRRREILSRFANFYCHFLLGVPISDLTAGFVCFRRKVLETIDFNRFHSLGYAFQVEFKFKAFKSKCSFVEIPIIFEDRQKGDSKMALSIILESAFTPFRLLFGSK